MGRAAHPIPLPEGEMSFGNLRVHLATFSVVVGAEPAGLTFYEFELLRVLCAEAGRIVHYDALCRAIWNSTGPKERRRLNVTMFRLRSKLAGSWPYRVETVRGRGYGLLSAATGTAPPAVQNGARPAT